MKIRVTTEYADAEAKRHTAVLERVVSLPAVDLEFRLTPSVTLEGEVVNARGDPVTSFLLLVKRAGDPGVGPAQFVNPESESNRFVAAGLVAGAYTIQLLQPYSNERVEVTAPATDVRIVTP